jgi:hypothetical protein
MRILKVARVRGGGFLALATMFEATITIHKEVADMTYVVRRGNESNDALIKRFLTVCCGEVAFRRVWPAQGHTRQGADGNTVCPLCMSDSDWLILWTNSVVKPRPPQWLPQRPLRAHPHPALRAAHPPAHPQAP